MSRVSWLYDRYYVTEMYTYSFPTVYVNVQKIRELMEGLVRQAGSQLHSMEDICSGLDSLYSGFHSLEQDVAYLCGRGSDVVYNLLSCVDDHKEDTYEDLDEIKDSLEDAKESLDRIESLVGCGGLGWRPVALLNFSNTDIPCPGDWTEFTPSIGERACGASQPGLPDCSEAEFEVGDEYTRVCGRIRAYQLGHPDAFRGHNIGNEQLNEPYVCGVSLTMGSFTEHIWTYAVGATEEQNAAMFGPEARCPCDGGLHPPPFVGNHYFCESGTDSSVNLPGVSFPDDLLWDGGDCISSSTCCTENFSPYFLRERESAPLPISRLEYVEMILPLTTYS